MANNLCKKIRLFTNCKYAFINYWEKKEITKNDIQFVNGKMLDFLQQIPCNGIER